MSARDGSERAGAPFCLDRMRRRLLSLVGGHAWSLTSGTCVTTGSEFFHSASWVRRPRRDSCFQNFMSVPSEETKYPGLQTFQRVQDEGKRGKWEESYDIHESPKAVPAASSQAVERRAPWYGHMTGCEQHKLRTR